MVGRGGFSFLEISLPIHTRPSSSHCRSSWLEVDSVGECQRRYMLTTTTNVVRGGKIAVLFLSVFSKGSGPLRTKSRGCSRGVKGCGVEGKEVVTRRGKEVCVNVCLCVG